MADQSVGDLKLIQYLNEAYGKERELETALQAHISMTTKKTYKKRLQDHLRETKSHARQVQQRIKQLGGKAEVVPAPGRIGDAASAVSAAATKAMTAAQGPLHLIRGTGESEKMLKNAKTEFSDEHEEIATYQAIETLADTVGDKDTAKLARTIRREEERMAKFLSGQITSLTKDVAREEIPASERRNGTSSTRRRTASSSRSRSSSNGSRATASRSKPARSGSRASSTRSKSTRAKSTRSSGSRSTRSRARAGSRS